MAMTTQGSGSLLQPGRLQRPPKGRIGLIVAGSLGTGLVVALVLVAAPFIQAKENVLTGMVLLAFALGWALLAVLSVRFSDQPQRWAAAPAVFFTLAGLISLIGSDAVQDVFGWVWPPVLLGLVVWMIVRARRQLRSRTRRWLLYPLLAVLTLASVGGGYETVRESIDATAYPMPGQLIDVGGHRLHLNCTGSGSPTVVLEPGLGEASSAMAWIASAVARDTRVCVYDRAGRGWSDAAERSTGRRANSDRPPHVVGARTRSRAVRPCRSLIRRPLHPHLRRQVPRPGCRHGLAGLHRTHIRS